MFIWTEALGCAEILGPMLESYCAHHNYPIHVYVYEDEIHYIPKKWQIIPVPIGTSKEFVTKKELSKAFEHGHRGTALLWASIISSKKDRFFLHLDADTIFLADVVSPIKEKLDEGFYLVGTRRPYKYKNYRTNFYKDTFFKLLPDTVNTHCFGFRVDKLNWNRELIALRIEKGFKKRFLRTLFPLIDFFDFVSLYLIFKESVFYLDSESQTRNGLHFRSGPIESSMISFSAVGSGCSFWKNPKVKTSENYRDFALRSFALYSSFLLNTEIDYPVLDSEFLHNKLMMLDKTNWSLKS